MRICPSCGKANNPTRSHCVRCGKSLYSSTEEPTVKPAAPGNRIGSSEVKTPEKIPDQPIASKTDSTKVTTDDRWVRPSEVSPDRMRTTSSSKGKSEMEKAREAFAKAEEVGIQEEGEGIVETRMLRASEVRELMERIPTQSETPSPASSMGMEAKPTPSPPSIPNVRPRDTLTEETPMTHVIQRPIEQPPPVHSEVQEPTVSAKKVERVPDLPVPPVSRPGVKPQKVGSTPEPTIEELLATAERKIKDTSREKIDAVLTCITEPEDLQDHKIKDLISNLSSLHMELQQTTANQIAISSQFDARVRESHNKAEVKRIHYESVNEQMRLAKQEWDDAKAEFDTAEKRRKKEVSNIEDRVKNIQKNINKTEDAIQKRVRELDKVREKIAQLKSQEV